MTPLDALKWRYATKQFDSAKKVSPSDWQTLEDSLVLSPSSFGLQPWKFFVVTSDAVKAELRPHSWGQAQITDCSHLVVLAHRTEVKEEHIDQWINTLSTVQGRSNEELAGYKDILVQFIDAQTPEETLAWAQRQTYIALGQLMTTAACMEIDTCPLEGISPKDYDQALGLEGSGFTTSVACAIGYRHSDDKYASTPKARFDTSEVITHIS